jgi:hypothetical protein
MGAGHNAGKYFIAKLSLAELALFSLNYHTASQPATHSGIVYFFTKLFFIASKLDCTLTLLMMEVDLKCFCNWKTSSIFLINGSQPQIFLKMEDDLKFFVNGRRP